MVTGEFNLNEMLEYLDSDEGADPVMIVAPMPRRWRDALVDVFLTAN